MTHAPLYVRIVSAYPWETTDLTIRVVGETASSLHDRIRAAIEAREVFAIQAVDHPELLEFSGELVRTVAVWEG